MKKHLSIFPLLALFSFFAVILSALFYTSSGAYYATYQIQGSGCPSYYHPVCGEKSGIKTLYQNLCTMNSAGATFVQWKTCNNYQSQYDYNHYVQPTYSYQPFCTQEYNPVCALKNGYEKTYSNKCFAIRDGAKFLYYGKCITKKICVPTHPVFCGWGEEKVNPGTDKWGCKLQEYCRKRVTNICPVIKNISFCGYGYSKVFLGYDSNGCSRGYECVKQYTDNSYTHFYPVHNYSSFEIARYKNSRTYYSINRGSEFTMNINAQDSHSTIVHIIPDGIELLKILKGNCEKTFIYGGTRLKCFDTDGIQYIARANYNTCQRKFSTTFMGYDYNNVYKTFTLDVK